jgi:all-trans-retinol 13,14-reductase
LSEKKFDVIIIGSGMGALACASVLAQLGKKRVLILERHSKFGGFTHMFKREGKYHWDVGLHYVGNMKKGKDNRKLFDYITGNGLDWHEMPEQFDIFSFPGFKFPARKGFNNFRADLRAAFPHETAAIDQYFSDIRKANNWMSRYVVSNALPGYLQFLVPLIRAKGRKLAMMHTGDYLNNNFKDEKLRAILVAQWGDYGMPPARSLFGVQAAITAHYFNGGYYPVGGSRAIADTIVPIVKAAGGEALGKHRVREILIRNGRAVGVRAEYKGGDEPVQKEFYADTIISAAGAYITYSELIPESVPIPNREEITRFPAGIANVTLYLGLKQDPRSKGIYGENYWLYESLDHDLMFARRNELLNGKVNGCYVSFPSLKDPQAQAHTAEVIAFTDYAPFARWADQPLKKRDEDYQELKYKITNSLLDYVESRMPGFRDMVDFAELATPLSTEHYTGHREGSIYGLPAIERRFGSRLLRHQSPVKNLLLTGSDVGLHGIIGAMMNGIITAGVVLNRATGPLNVFRKLLK